MKDSGLLFLDHFTELKVFGEGTEEFLQGQIATDIKKIDEENSSLSCICNAKGRVISSFILLKDNSLVNSFSFIGPKETMIKTKKELSKYISFYKSEMKIVNNSNLFACKKDLLRLLAEDLGFNKNNTRNYQGQYFLNFLNKNYVLIYATKELAKVLKEISTKNYKWNQDEILSMNVEITEETSEKYTPHELNYPTTGRIDFEKGCYTGQEIIARMQYRSETHPQLFNLVSKSKVLSNMVITPKASDKKIGNVVSSSKLKDKYYFLVSLSKELETKEIRIRELDLDLKIN
ncbi:MAG: YgfZ/GcvT domain-containing protein [Gammaproteobacteria bacterium]